MDYQSTLNNWHKNKIESGADIDKYLHNFRILFAYHSGKIENEHIDYHDTREVFENGRVSSYTGDIRTLFEQKNQKDCYEIIKPFIANKNHLSTDIIKQIHFELTKGTYDDRRYTENDERPGEFKKHDYIVGLNEVGSNAKDVEKDLVELIEEVNTHDGSNVLKAAAYLHACFENIHPFADGNGRVGRTLLNYYLMINNHPPIIIFESDRKEYFKALEMFDTEEELTSLYEFLKQQCMKTWSKTNCQISEV